jgi:hypothetical protein
MLISQWTPTPRIHLPRVAPARRVGASSQMSGVVVSQTDGTATLPASTPAAESDQRAPHAKRGGVFFAVVPPVASGCSRVPNWSLERTSTGKALGPPCRFRPLSSNVRPARSLRGSCSRVSKQRSHGQQNASAACPLPAAARTIPTTISARFACG